MNTPQQLAVSSYLVPVTYQQLPGSNYLIAVTCQSYTARPVNKGFPAYAMAKLFSRVWAGLGSAQQPGNLKVCARGSNSLGSNHYLNNQ